MIRIHDLRFRYGKNAPEVLRGINLELDAGEIGVLLGKNGSGKTTLFQNLVGVTNPTGGTMLFQGEDLLKMNRRERAKRIAYVPQHIHFGALSVYDSILMGRVAYFGMKAGKSDFQVVERLLAEMDLEDFAYRNAEELSGGEKQKIAIARAMAQEPKMLIFDEPTGNLDMKNEALILEEAKKLAKEQNIAILSSLHDLNQAAYFGDRLFFLRDGVVTDAVTPAEVTEELIEKVFDVRVKILSLDHQKIILGGYHNAL